MPLYSKLTSAIDKGPAGSPIGAFFDLDRTLLSGFSAAAFLMELVRSGRMGWGDLAEALLMAARFELGVRGFSGFVAESSKFLRGTPESELEEIGERLFRDQLAAGVYPESRALVRAHQRKRHTVAVVSSALRYQIEPLARDLGIERVICTRLEVKGGKFTGEVIHPTCYGIGKALAVRDLAAQLGLDLKQSYFYTDSDEDLPLLDLVGRPRPTNPNRQLKAVAAKRGWPSQHFTSRGVPGQTEIVRTALTLGSIAPSLLLGLPAGMLDRSWRSTVNLAVSTWGDLGTALAGVDLRVEGEQHLWSKRPGVFIFNHQSAIDVLLLCKLLRRDIVGIAKRELQRTPIFGRAFSLAGTVFIDRFHHDRAISNLEPAIDALRRGLSLVVAPEGTRSPTPRLGRFKKGAFHLAMTAKVPIIPIVFRNALDVLPKNGFILHPATVEVVVFPPIPTQGWKKRDLDRHIGEIQQLYLDALGN